MCGITGCVWTDPSLALSRDALASMTDVLLHRGPDDDGAYISEYLHRAPYSPRPGAALGFRRLSIIDLAGSRQPLSNEDATVHVIFNGEIYNYRDLRRRLEGSGHQFQTAGDGETIVHLYEDEGVGFLDHLVGMFAIAVWDERRGRLILARDRLGQKPLVYRLEPHRLIFASELKSILAAPGVPRDVDPGAIDEYLAYLYVPHPNTIFRGIRKLPPAHYAVYEEGRLTINPYWRPDFNVEEPPALQRHANELIELLTESVRLRLQGDVPLGAFLSGGIDSSIVTALAQQLATQQLKTFSIGFSIPEYDESGYARRVAEHLGTDHHEFVVEPSCGDLLPKLVWFYDEPFADSSTVPTYFLSQLTRRQVTIALSGDGGDELFAGYDRYQAVRLAARFDRLPASVRSLLSARPWQLLPSSGRRDDVRRRMKRFLEVIRLSPERRYVDWMQIFNQASRACLYTDDFIHSLPDSDPAEFLLAPYERSRNRDIVTATTLTDVVTYLPCDLCHKVDIASMAHGLECRQPMLDHRVVEHAARLPISEKLRGGHRTWMFGRGKRILRAAFGKRLPKEVFTRRKMGFAVPMDHWFRGELRPMLSEVLLDPLATGRGYFRPEVVQQLLDEHDTGRFNHAQRLWSLLILELWHREWVDG
jgi:asparagine synthase (glutamine-hydrolysing)